MMNRKHVAALVAFGLALPGVTRAQDAPVEEQIVNQMNKVFGVHAGFRANHAKGVVAEGKFKASTEASGLSKAVLFGGTEVPVTVRFSDSTGVSNLPDGSDDANPHGMAVKFHLPDGSDMDIVINSLKFFPVSTSEEFRDCSNFVGLAASGGQADEVRAVRGKPLHHPGCLRHGRHAGQFCQRGLFRHQCLRVRQQGG